MTENEDVIKARKVFPAKIAFYYDKKHKTITARILNSKAKVENMRYQDIKATNLAIQSEKDSALIKVGEYQSSKEYCIELVDLWIEWEDMIEQK